MTNDRELQYGNFKLESLTTIWKLHLLDSYISFEHIQIFTQLLSDLTTNHQSHGRSVSLYILIFSILNSQLLNDS